MEKSMLFLFEKNGDRAGWNLVIQEFPVQDIFWDNFLRSRCFYLIPQLICWVALGGREMIDEFAKRFFSFVTLNGCDDRLMVILVVDFPREGYNKSVNLQYIMLGDLFDGTNESSNKSLMFQVLFSLYILSRLLFLFL